MRNIEPDPSGTNCNGKPVLQDAADVPGCGFPPPWSVYRWIDGAPVTEQAIQDLPQFADDLARFLAALYRIDPTGGPPPGPHNFFRGGPLAVYDGEVQDALGALQGHIDTALAAGVWQAALRTAWRGRLVWFHGDAQPGNLLAKNGRLCAVIDFGTCGVGRPCLRHHDRPDVPKRSQQPRLQGTIARGSSDLDPGTRLGDLEGHEGTRQRAGG